MTTMRMSSHLTRERANRLRLLEEYLGYSDKVLLETYSVRNDARMRITTTGICYVIDLYEDYIITAYAVSVSQAMAIWYKVYNKPVPQKFFKRIVRNMERHPDLFTTK